MNLGLIGLGRMGMAIAKRVIDGGHKVVAYDPSTSAQEDAKKLGVEIVPSPKEVAVNARVIWMMVPAGDAVDETISSIKDELQAGDILIDGGNSNYQDTIRRSKGLDATYLDCGTSGGLHGEDIGFSLMIGGDKEAFDKIVPLLEVIAAKDGYAYMGPSGAGHYVKMVHNGVEYALLQAYAEGFHLLREGHYDLDLEKIAHVWNNGGVVRSWILSLAEEIFKEDQSLEDISGAIGENKTGRWTHDEALKRGVDVRLIDEALKIRSESRENGGNFGTKVVAMLRNKFGGHLVKRK